MRTRVTMGNSRRGIALLMVVFVMTALAGVSAALVSTSLFRHASARTAYELEHAFEAAQTGIDLALFEIQRSTDYGADGVGNTSGTLVGKAYTVTIDPPFAGTGEYTLESVGEFAGVTQGIEVVVSTDIKLGVGLFGTDALELNGNYMVDSYDGAAGTYASQVVGDHAGGDAVLGSNGDITLGGDAVWGSVVPGPTGTITGDTSSVSGSTAPSGSVETMDPVVYAPPIGSSGPYSAGSSTLTGGSYRYDSMSMSGDVLTIDGAVVLYIDGSVNFTGQSSIVITPGSTLMIYHGSGDFDMSGGAVVNENQDPSNVTLFSASTTSIDITGSAEFYGLIYAPEADFKSAGNSEIYGAVIAGTITLSGSGSFHFDENMIMPSTGADVYFVKLARSLSTT